MSSVGCIHLTPAELGERLKSLETARLVDVREPEEFAAVHVQRAENLPLGQVAAMVSAWPRNSEIILLCRSGPRAFEAARRLAAVGFTDLKVVPGGTKACAEAGLPLVRG